MNTCWATCAWISRYLTDPMTAVLCLLLAPDKCSNTFKFKITVHLSSCMGSQVFVGHIRANDRGATLPLTMLLHLAYCLFLVFNISVSWPNHDDNIILAFQANVAPDLPFSRKLSADRYSALPGRLLPETIPTFLQPILPSRAVAFFNQPSSPPLSKGTWVYGTIINSSLPINRRWSCLSIAFRHVVPIHRLILRLKIESYDDSGMAV